MANQPRPISGKVAVVTGGARGIGRATAQALAREGVRVAVADLDAAGAERAAAALGPAAYGAGVDVTDRAAFTAFLDQTERRLGPLDVLVNNAGIMPVGPFEAETDAAVTRQLELNLHAVIHGTKEGVRRMRPRGTGHVVNVASVAGRAGFPGAATYSATKHAVVGLSEALRGELRGTGVEVSVVLPGHVRTELTAGLRAGRGFGRAPVSPEAVAAGVVGVLRRPRFEVWIPRELGWLLKLARALPRPAAEALSRALGTHRMLLESDVQARAAYEARAAASVPSRPGGAPAAAPAPPPPAPR